MTGDVARVGADAEASNNGVLSAESPDHSGEAAVSDVSGDRAGGGASADDECAGAEGSTLERLSACAAVDCWEAAPVVAAGSSEAASGAADFSEGADVEWLTACLCGDGGASTTTTVSTTSCSGVESHISETGGLVTGEVVPGSSNAPAKWPHHVMATSHANEADAPKRHALTAALGCAAKEKYAGAIALAGGNAAASAGTEPLRP
mmetsp:Transcript_19725/g.57404  ORF Transcript_19725/g.57404 Transcript_19725/m.57404 type:complete len:206 (-) Transcript_19725:7-624(-)